MVSLWKCFSFFLLSYRIGKFLSFFRCVRHLAVNTVSHRNLTIAAANLCLQNLSINRNSRQENWKIEDSENLKRWGGRGGREGDGILNDMPCQTVSINNSIDSKFQRGFLRNFEGFLITLTSQSFLIEWVLVSRNELKNIYTLLIKKWNTLD